MKFGIIIGSHRSESQSSKVGNYIERRIKDQLSEEHSTYVLDLKDNPLPLWSEDKWEEGGKLAEQWKPYSQELHGCDAFVIISPEWAGMVPSGLKNFFLLCDGHELAHKPAMIVTVSAGINGAYPVAELRMSSYKNTMVVYTPGHIIVRNVNDVLNDDTMNPEDQRDYSLKQRINYELPILEQYAKALEQVRDSGLMDYKNYPFGM